MYSLYIGVIGRSGGSTTNSLAYRSGCTISCPLTGEVFNHGSKSVQDVQLLLPQDAPDWARELQGLISENRQAGIQELCHLVEGSEGRKDSQLYREFRVSLPREFTEEQSKDLVNEFLKDQVCSLGIAAITNYHFDVNPKTGETNPHCHILMLTRSLEEKGLGLKERSWNSKVHHEQWRSQWAAYGNYHLLKNGFVANWDHRSYKDRGINFEPQPKLGSKIIQMESQAGQDPKSIHSKPVTERGRQYQEVKLRNLYTLINRPEEALNSVSKQQVTFMWGDVAKVLARYVDDQALFERLSLKIQASRELVCLEDRGDFLKNVYTTRTRLAEEKKFVETIHHLKGNESHGVDISVVEASIEKANIQLRVSQNDPKASLSEDQVSAIQHMSLANQLSLVEGYAGSGKTTVMKVMKEIWEKSGYQVVGLAPTGKAAENLSECGIASTTIHRFLKSFEQGRSQYDSKTIMVLDEAGMVDHQRFHGLIQAVATLGVKLVASGDRGQLSPVEGGVPFRLAIAEAGKSDLTTILRQKVSWQKEATVLFGEGKAEEALRVYLDRGHIRFCEEKKPQEVVERYNLSRRMVGNIGGEIQKDIKGAQGRGEALTFAGHRDYGLFLEWQKTRDVCVKELYSHLATYRDQMRNLGVDGVDFAKKVMKCGLVPFGDASALAKDLKIDWRDKATHVCDPRFETKRQLIADWFQSTKDYPLASQAMMAFSNKDVQELNDLARDLKRGAGDLGKEEYIFTIERNGGEELGRPQVVREERRLSVGDQIVFTKNDKGLGVNNGTLGRVTELTKSNIKVSLETEGVLKEISFSPNLYKNFDHGWAVTVHKNQGATVDRSFVLASFEQYKNLAYVAMTRHAETVQVYGSRFEFWRDEKLPERLGLAQEKLSTLDYVSSDQALALIQSDETLWRSSFKKVGQRIEAVGYVGKRALSSAYGKFFGRSVESHSVRIEEGVLESLKSESVRAEEKHRGLLPDSISVVDTKNVGDHGQGLQQEIYKTEGVLRVKGDGVEKSIDQQENKTLSRPSRIRGEYSTSAQDGSSGSLISRESFRKFVTDVERSLRVEDLARDLLGAQNINSSLSTASQLRFGRKGSLQVTLSGVHAGRWQNWESNQQGRILDLIQTEKGLDFKGALSYARDYCRGDVVGEVDAFLKGEKGRGVLSAERQVEQQAHQEALRLENQKKEVDSLAIKEGKIADVQALIEKAQPLLGTPAESYLRNERGIRGDLSDSLKYLLPKTSFQYGGENRFIKTGALVSIAKTLEGETKAVQLTYLTPEGKRCVDDQGNKFIKATYGVSVGAFVELHKGDRKNPIILAEGVETALSVKETGLKGSYYCSLGVSNIDKLEVKNRDIIIAGDWDGSTETNSWKQIEKAKASLTEQGNRVHVVYPVEKDKLSQALTPEKIDFNDLLKDQGVGLVWYRVLDQVPVEISLEISHRENKEEKTDDRIQDLSADKEASDLSQHDPAAKHVQDQEKPVEKDVEVSDGEAVKTEQALKENILAYFEHELSLEENKFFNKENVFKHIDADPLDYLKWWQETKGGAQFDPSRPWAEQHPSSENTNKNISDPTPERGFNAFSATDDFVQDLRSLDDVIKVLTSRGSSPERLDRYSKDLENKLLHINEKSVVMDDLKERYPEVADRAIQLKEERQQIQNQEQSLAQRHGLDR